METTWFGAGGVITDYCPWCAVKRQYFCPDNYMPDKRLRRLFLDTFSYEPETGLLRWKIDTKRRKAGDEAGSLSVNAFGHRRKRVGLSGKVYYQHRLIWFMQTGEWPEQIDHINGDATDNRWVNLRNVGRKENDMNRPMLRNNNTGIQGVTWDRNKKKWYACIRSNGKNVCLYYGLDFFEACCRRRAAEIRFGYHENHGMRYMNEAVILRT